MVANPIESLWNQQVFPLIESETAKPLDPEYLGRIKSLVATRSDFPLALAVVFQQREERDLLIPRIRRIDHNRRRVDNLMALYFSPVSFVHIAILQSTQGINVVAEMNKALGTKGLLDEISQAQMHLNAARVKQLYEEDHSGFSVLRFFLENQQFQQQRQSLPFPEMVQRLELIGVDRYRFLYNQLSSEQRYI